MFTVGNQAVDVDDLMLPDAPTEVDAGPRPDDITYDYYRANSEDYVRLEERKSKSSKRTAFVQSQDDTNMIKVPKYQGFVIEEFKEALKNIDSEHKIISSSPINTFLDLCFAPGGFAKYILEAHPESTGFGITLSEEEGGSQSLIDSSQTRFKQTHLDLQKADLINTALEFNSLYGLQPHSFDLVVADGHHALAVADFEMQMKVLLLSELMIAFQMLKENGRLLVRFARKEMLFYSTLLVALLKSFTDVVLLKPIIGTKNTTGVFYALCTGYKLSEGDDMFKAFAPALWDLKHGIDVDDIAGIVPREEIIEKFGSTLIEKLAPVWKAQLQGFTKDRQRKKVSADRRKPVRPDYTIDDKDKLFAEEKRQNRASRFGVDLNPEPELKKYETKGRRAQKRELEVSVRTPEEEEKRRKRAQRFGVPITIEEPTQTGESAAADEPTQL